MTAIAANLEWMFTEAGPDTASRIRAAAAAGIKDVEIWTWRDKDIPAIRTALAETGVRLLSLIVEPQLQITDPSTHADYLVAVAESLEVARQLDAPYLVAVAGDDREGISRAEQHDAVVAALGDAANVIEDERSAVVLLLENLNSRVDHVGTYLDSTEEGLDIVAEVGSAHLRLLLDAYHALVMDEDLEQELDGRIDLVGHVQVADAPGRHEPGTGSLDWQKQISALRELGYTGVFGMEYQPTTETVASLAEITGIVDAVDGAKG